MNKRIAIIGGGFLGAELAKSLDQVADVTLIEQNTHFVHAPALVRAVVSPSILDKALIPYDTLLTSGKVVQERAVSVKSNGVELQSGKFVEADYIVVATGSLNATPFKPNGSNIETLRTSNARVNDQLTKADSVVIVGAGAVGTELAGEIAHHMAGKKVTLISSTDELFPEQPPKLGRELTRKLRAAGVELALGSRVENLQSMTEPYAGTVKLSSGREINADLIFPVIGSKAVSNLLEDLPDTKKSGANRILADFWMRPSSLPNVFAAGDTVDIGDAMTVVAAGRQKEWLEKTLTALAEGKNIEMIKPYKPWKKAPILVPLGPKKGNSFLMLFTAGDFTTRKMKGQDLFLTKYNKIFGRTI